MTDFPQRSAAVLVGLTYSIPGAEEGIEGVPSLVAPPRDVEHLETFLRLHNLNDVSVYTDEVQSPTDIAWERGSTRAIKSYLSGLVSRSMMENLEFCLFYFSGHGAEMPLDEDDQYPADENNSIVRPGGAPTAQGMDEAIVSTNWLATGPIVDNVIRNIMANANPATRFVLIFDCCNSHTMADLPFEYYSSTKFLTNSKVLHQYRGKSIISLSGCYDKQLSDENTEGYTWFTPVTPTFKKSVLGGNMVASGGMTGSLYTLGMSNSLATTKALDFLDTLQNFVSSNVDPSQTPTLSSSFELDKTTTLFPLTYVSDSRTAAYNYAKGLLYSYTSDPNNRIASTILTTCNANNNNVDAIKSIAMGLAGVGSVTNVVSGDKLSWVLVVSLLTMAICNVLQTINDGFWKSTNPTTQTILFTSGTSSFFANDMQQAAILQPSTVSTYITSTNRYQTAFTTILANAAYATKLSALVGVLNQSQTHTLALFTAILNFAATPEKDGLPNLVSALQGLYSNAAVTAAQLRTLVDRLVTLYTSLAGTSIAKSVADVVINSTTPGNSAVPAGMSANVVSVVLQNAYVGASNLTAALKAASCR